MFSSTIGTGADHVRPPSREVMELRAVGPASPALPSAGFSSKVRFAAYATPSAPKEIHGSLARSRAPPVQRESFGSGAVVQVAPPSPLDAARLASAPPSTGKRSCWKTAITRFA